MKTSFLILFYASCSMSGKPKGHSSTEVMAQSAPGQHHEEMLAQQNTFGLSGMVHQYQTEVVYPLEMVHQHEQQTYQQIENPEIEYCIVSETGGCASESFQANVLSQAHISSQANFPSETNVPLQPNLPKQPNFLKHSPAQPPQQHQTPPQLLLNKKPALIDEFHGVLSEVVKEVLTEMAIVKIIKAIENNFDGTAEHSHGHGDRFNQQQKNGNWERQRVSSKLIARTEWVAEEYVQADPASLNNPNVQYHGHMFE